MKALLLIVPLLAGCGGICLQNVTCYRNLFDGGCQVSQPKCCSGIATCPTLLNPTYDKVEDGRCEVVPNNLGCL